MKKTHREKSARGDALRRGALDFFWPLAVVLGLYVAGTILTIVFMMGRVTSAHTNATVLDAVNRFLHPLRPEGWKAFALLLSCFALCFFSHRARLPGKAGAWFQQRRAAIVRICTALVAAAIFSFLGPWQWGAYSAGPQFRGAVREAIIEHAGWQIGLRLEAQSPAAVRVVEAWNYLALTTREAQAGASTDAIEAALRREKNRITAAERAKVRVKQADMPLERAGEIREDQHELGSFWKATLLDHAAKTVRDTTRAATRPGGLPPAFKDLIDAGVRLKMRRESTEVLLTTCANNPAVNPIHEIFNGPLGKNLMTLVEDATDRAAEKAWRADRVDPKLLAQEISAAIAHEFDAFGSQWIVDSEPHWKTAGNTLLQEVADLRAAASPARKTP